MRVLPLLIASGVVVVQAAGADNPPRFKVKTRDWGEKYQSVQDVYGKTSGDRQAIAELRERNINLCRRSAAHSNS